MSDKKPFFTGIASKLAILMGGAVLVTGAQASTTTTMPASSPDANNIALDVTGVRKPLPAKLILKQQSNGFKLIAAHGSHSSHSSHGSHGSHSSHSSRAS